MKPIRLTMEAYGSYGKKTVVDFTTPKQNLFLVSGATGSGKTTIFDAVVFALYGDVSGSGGRGGGIGLQSQYADSKVEPYVELEFSEGTGIGADGAVVPTIYRVRRTPQYKKVSRKMPVAETVSLYLPDGSEYPEKLRETNKKILEIVGLTHEQFLQVGMIAQGEFMRMLRVGTDEKKEIFRKLFGTDVFRKVTEELKARQDAERKALDRVMISLRSEAGQVRIPVSLMNDADGNSTEFAGLQDCIGRIQSMEMPSVPDLEVLEKGLPKLLAELKKQVAEEESSAGTLEARRDQALAAFKQAEVLEAQYQKLAQATEAYRVLHDRRPEMDEKKTRQLQADAAWEIHTEWRRFFDLKDEMQKDQQALEEARRVLPGLTQVAADATKAMETAQAERDSVQEAFAKQEEKTKRAGNLFAEIQAAESRLQRLNAEERTQKTAVNAAKSTLDDFERQESNWNETVRTLSDTAAKKLQVEQQGKKIRELLDWKATLMERDAALAQAKVNSENARHGYETAAEAFRQKNAEYQARQDAYLDAQAGVLAREKLRPGMPCPVCGSIEHPNPCMLADGETLSREELDALRNVVSGLNEKRMKASEIAAGRKKEYEQQLENLNLDTGNFMMEVDSMGIQERELPKIGNCLQAMRSNLAMQFKALEKEEQAFLEAQDALAGAGKKKEQLRTALTEAENAMQGVQQRIATENGALQNLLKKREYASEDEANEALERVYRSLMEASRNADRLKMQADAATEAQAKQETMQAHYERILPGKQKECEDRQKVYETVRGAKNLEEAVWKQLVREVPRPELEKLREEVQTYREQLKEAQGTYKAAKEAVGANLRPDLPALQAAMVQAREAADGAAKHLELLRNDRSSNEETEREFCALMKKRAEASARVVRMSGLYSRLAGKVSGARMDLETFVQRYYLERILYAANRRFMEMSSGEFELRMMPLDDAGSGRNKGLDLLVYSTVTGKEREVGTLSGGESFMAALALALGMADQIQASSAGIHLDMMFIDEGFGSLDDYSREQAVRVLQRMAGGSRLIGIISHVTELKQEIEDQLLVTRDEEGSHVRWQIS